MFICQVPTGNLVLGFFKPLLSLFLPRVLAVLSSAQASFVRKVKRIYEEVHEQNVEEVFEFMSEQNMRNETPPFSEILDAVT